MINKNIHKLEAYCKDYTKIENYKDAVSSPLKYDLHHRLEISENKSRKQLITENLYYGRPPEELIFLEHGEHQRLHKKGVNHKGENNPMFGKNMSTDTRKKMSEAHKGEKSYMYGKPKSAETRKRMSDANKGKNLSAETKQKMSEARKGKHWHLENRRRVYTD